MSDYKIAGHCTTCDAECFEIIERWGEHERRPGEPKRIGAPLDGATRITFLLVDGSRMDLTFCKDCAAGLTDDSYSSIWQKVLRSWTRELEEKGDEPPEWFTKQYENGLLSEMGRHLVKDLNPNG